MDKILGITDDSRKVRPGWVFVAIKGKTVDGHKYIKEAIKNGAVKVYDGPDSRKKLGELASEFYGNPSRKLKIIGVTGTKGKTTTCHLIYHILTKLGKKAGLISSITAKIGDHEVDTGFHVTSPDVVSLHKFLKEMVDEGVEYAVVEVSSHGIDQERIAGVNFEVGVLTNIAPEHLDYHKNFKEYKRVKMSFLKTAKFSVIAPTDTDLNLLPGKFNNLDVEAAIRTVEILGFDKQKALDSIKSFSLPSGRLEEIKNNLGLKIYVDFAHTPDSIEVALKYFRSQTNGKLIVVFGSAGERDPYKRPKMGKIAGNLSDIIVLTAEDPRTEKVEDTISQIKNGIKSDNIKVYEETDRKKAIMLALKVAKKGDLIALLGKGHEKSMNLDGIHEISWSDQEVVRKILENEN